MSSVRAFHPFPEIWASSSGSEYQAVCKCGWHGPVHASPIDEHPGMGEGSRFAAYIDAKKHFKERTGVIRRDA